MDRGIYPLVHDGGIVEPGQSCSRSEESGKEGISDGRETSRGSAAGSWEGTTGRQRTSGRPTPKGPGPPSLTSSILSELELNGEAAGDLEGVAGAYPQVEFRPAPNLLWLLNSIEPIRALGETALLVTAYPLDPGYDVVSWAWWGPGLIWIGPRHTNYYPSGSICSFEPIDRTWRRGQPLANLLDLHVVWIVRHLFMRRFGRWPGQQFFHTAWERLNEHRPGELCGGCDSGRRYEDCCRSLDQAINPVERLVSFMIKIGGNWKRRPPSAVREYVYGCRKIPPSLSDLALHRRPEKFKICLP